jgi:hypothetical protein
MNNDFPFVALTEKQTIIVKAYERIRTMPNVWNVPVGRRVALELNRKLDQNKGNSYVYKVIRKWQTIKRNLERKEI